MNRHELVKLIRRKKSFLCVGLDTDPHRLPEHIKDDDDAMFTFNKAIINATLPYAVSFKLNIAFYEAQGEKGWDTLRRTIDIIPRDEALIIADAKRGDIGNTAAQYAKAFFKELNCHAVTINPYMGSDSVTPFLEYKDRWSIVLGLTSNSGAADIELLKLDSGKFVFEAAIERIAQFGSPDKLMFVVGATKQVFFSRIRKIVPDHFLLVPGIGAQGGQLSDLKSILNKDCGLLVNSSRQIIYASSGIDFASASELEAKRIQVEMSKMLNE